MQAERENYSYRSASNPSKRITPTCYKTAPDRGLITQIEPVYLNEQQKRKAQNDARQREYFTMKLI